MEFVQELRGICEGPGMADYGGSAEAGIAEAIITAQMLPGGAMRKD